MTPRDGLEVRVSRSEPGAAADFTIERRGLRVVLDALAAIERLDPSLGYRYSCRSGLCGTCTVVTDGRAGLACQTRLDPRARRITVAPMGGYPVVRDLIVDPAPFDERWAAAGTVVARPGVGTSALGPAAGAGAEAAAHLDCISCGACTAACDAWSADRPFLGPAALTRAFVVLASGGRPGDVGGRGNEVGRSATLDLDGPDGCHGIGACTLACPKQLDPSLAIRRLRRRLLVGTGA